MLKFFSLFAASWRLFPWKQAVAADCSKNIRDHINFGEFKLGLAKTQFLQHKADKRVQLIYRIKGVFSNKKQNEKPKTSYLM